MSPAAVPRTSFIAGCTSSVPFTRAFLKTSLSELDASTEAKQSLFIDDLAHISSGNWQDVFDAISSGARGVLKVKAKLHLTLSDKCVLVSSSRSFAAALVSHLTPLGLELKVADVGRDVGILFNPTRKRNCKVLKGRLGKAEQMHKVVCNLARRNRFARKLHRSGVSPLAFWGASALGVPKTILDHWRGNAADDVGTFHSWRCSVTAVAFCLGPRGDPSVALLGEQVRRWLCLWHRAGQNRG